MPKPAAAFSALAMTRSIAWWSTRAAEALADELAAGPADDVANKKDAHVTGTESRTAGTVSYDGRFSPIA